MLLESVGDDFDVIFIAFLIADGCFLLSGVRPYISLRLIFPEMKAGSGMAAAVISLILVTVLHAHYAHGVRPGFRTFEDYLQHLDKSLQSSIVQLGGESGTATADPAAFAIDPSAAADNSLLPRIPDDDKKNVTCCVLGELAGDKGFHCYAEFYAARIVLRNANRAHGKKLGFYGRFKVPRYAERLMKTFEQCVAGHGLIFHTCCHLATLERNGTRPKTARGRPKV